MRKSLAENVMYRRGKYGSVDGQRARPSDQSRDQATGSVFCAVAAASGGACVLQLPVADVKPT